MHELEIYSTLVAGYPILAAVIAVFLMFITVPYGRHNAQKTRTWGLEIGSRAGWLLMEVPACLAPVLFFILGKRHDAVIVSFLLLWQVHYVYRAFVFPFRRRGGVATMPLTIALMGLVFNLLNTYLNWRYLTYFAPPYELSWFYDPRFIVGVAIFFLGFTINHHADWVLINLRQPGETGYKIPYGGLYRYVSCPNYLGELLEWCGWAILTWSFAGLGFAVWTAANLIPRALAHHRDYRRRFADYPLERRAIIPFIL